MGQMTYAEKEALKQKIQSSLRQSSSQKTLERPVPPTLNPNEFHPDQMIAGSTGTYHDMQGGSHFSHYDCGHEYDDSVLKESKKEMLSKAGRIRESLKNQEMLQNAVVMGEIMNRRGRRRRQHIL